MATPPPEKFAAFRDFVLDPGNEERLLKYLKTYSTNHAYTGAFFHDLSYAGPSHPDRFDISDTASLSLLSVTLNPRMTNQLTAHRTEYTVKLEEALAREPDRDLGELSVSEISKLESNDGLNTAWSILSEIHGVGPTRVSKLLSRKRPRLIPIWDSVISRMLGLDSTKSYWTIFHTALTADDRKLDLRLSALAEEAGVAHRYSRIRVLDILAWMHGTDAESYEDRVLTELDDEPSGD